MALSPGGENGTPPPANLLVLGTEDQALDRGGRGDDDAVVKRGHAFGELGHLVADEDFRGSAPRSQLARGRSPRATSSPGVEAECERVTAESRASSPGQPWMLISAWQLLRVATSPSIIGYVVYQDCGRIGGPITKETDKES
ncbi:MAG: hypothetical protein M1826_005355 [Phylliscum demangeonii]|nr:MAG: hypothetical protein M1826_005355 [Phylliscum demangeonii]